MKKRIYLILLFIPAIFFSCKDNSGEFVEQLFTNDQIASALKQCITVASDSTLNTLCVVDTTKHEYGYTHYADSTYRITLPASAKQVVDTLNVYGYKNQIDTLILRINRAAELCGNKIKIQFWDTLVKSITFPNPNLILHGGDNAITNFVKETKQSELNTLLETSILVEQFNTLQVIQRWNMLQKKYSEITGDYPSIDILVPSVRQMSSGFFKKMSSVEEAVRRYPELRGNKNGMLYQVFATLK